MANAKMGFMRIAVILYLCCSVDDSIVQAVAGEENSHARFCGKQVGIPTGAGEIGFSYRVVRFRNHSPLIGSVLWDTDIEGAI